MPDFRLEKLRRAHVIPAAAGMVHRIDGPCWCEARPDPVSLHREPLPPADYDNASTPMGEGPFVV